MLDSHLSWIEGPTRIAHHKEHVDKVDEDAGSRLRVSDCEEEPLIDDHEHQITEETQQEEQLGKKNQVHVESPSEVSAQ